MGQKPSIGRTVHLWFPDRTDPLPLIITDVHSDEVVSGVVLSMFSFVAGGRIVYDGANCFASVEHRSVAGKSSCCWDWPTRV